VLRAPYCSDENRIGRLWLDPHPSVIRNHLCRAMAELVRAVHRYLTTQFDLEEVIAYAARTPL
jgi:hypothetical protein